MIFQRFPAILLLGFRAKSVSVEFDHKIKYVFPLINRFVVWQSLILSLVDALKTFRSSNSFFFSSFQSSNFFPICVEFDVRREKQKIRNGGSKTPSVGDSPNFRFGLRNRLLNEILATIQCSSVWKCRTRCSPGHWTSPSFSISSFIASKTTQLQNE